MAALSNKLMSPYCQAGKVRGIKPAKPAMLEHWPTGPTVPLVPIHPVPQTVFVASPTGNCPCIPPVIRPLLVVLVLTEAVC